MRMVIIVTILDDWIHLCVHEGHDEDVGGDGDGEDSSDEDDFPLPGSYDSNVSVTASNQQ